MLNYAFDPTIVNPVSARVGQQVMGGIRSSASTGPRPAVEVRQNNYQVRVGTAYSINEKTVFPRRLRQVLPHRPASRSTTGSARPLR